jgi:RNA polymerase sigma-70 factor (ECF subfamily)
MDATSDRDLILRTRRGETQAFGELVQRYQNAVFNVCYRVLGERREAEDLTQETFLRVYSRLGLYDLERPFGPWLRRVAANLCLNRLEILPAPQPALDDERDADDPAVRPEAAVEQRQQTELLRAAMLSLPLRYRVIIEMRHYQEMSYDEISESLHIPLSDVKSDLFRARKLLAGTIFLKICLTNISTERLRLQPWRRLLNTWQSAGSVLAWRQN